MADSDSNGKASDNVSVGSNVSSTVSICYSCQRETCKKFWSSFNSYWRLTSLFVAVALYLILGGIVFNAVEGPSERRRIEQVQMERVEAFNNLTDMLMNLTNLTEEEARNTTIAIIALGVVAAREIPAEQSTIWDYASALFFSSTVITTIGYGTIAPTTRAGRIIFMFYAVFGIPLALVFLAQIGSVIDKFIHALLRPVRRRWGAKVSRSVAVILIFLITIVFFILIPGAIFYDIETWTYLESVYYAVVTLTTVGFGDFVPATAGMRVTGIGLRLYKLMSTAWLWIGLAMVSALLTEMQSLLVALGKWYHSNNCCIKTRTHMLEIKKANYGTKDSSGSDESETNEPEASA